LLLKKVYADFEGAPRVRIAARGFDGYRREAYAVDGYIKLPPPPTGRTA
jgi:hypothetical protein